MEIFLFINFALTKVGQHRIITNRKGIAFFIIKKEIKQKLNACSPKDTKT